MRTDDGRYFEEYTFNNYIAIGWNNISLYELRNNKYEDSIRSKLLDSEKLDINDPNTKGKITGIINKLHAFDNLKKGDVILVPSKGSQRIAFEVIKTGVTIVKENVDSCEYLKRKEVIYLLKMIMFIM
ncbi:hypothetical protein [Sphingobacterium daejeonense]|uniref:hypothetical protein n=1 Tax=Sphingobacterium daejeonense TaxID=371142 RepID=UPI003D318948